VIPVGRALGLAAAWAALVRPRLQTWGAAPVEAQDPLPGDELVPARWQTTRAITTTATAEHVWPLLVQMGWQRAGWYSLDVLERLVGAGEFAGGRVRRRRPPPLPGPGGG
jgi:proline iminopeptidase